MCYSALLKQDMKSLEEEFGADVVKELWNQVYESERINPKKFKFAAEDGRIFPNYFAPVITADKGKRLIKPMRYSAYAPSYMPQGSANKLTTFNARRDSLNKRFWSESFGVNHGIIILNGFYEWVKVESLLKAGVVDIETIKKEFEAQSLARKEKIAASGKKYKMTKTEALDPIERQIIIQFSPENSKDLIVPVIYSQDPETGLEGFAIITDEPNKEIMVAGHDRMPVHLAESSVDKWLNIQGKGLLELEALLSEVDPQYFKHKLAA